MGKRKNDVFSWLLLAAGREEEAARYKDYSGGGEDVEEKTISFRAYSTRCRKWREIAEDGNDDAMYKLGKLISQYGKGWRSDAEATGWYKKAAAAGNAMAMLAYGDELRKC